MKAFYFAFYLLPLIFISLSQLYASITDQMSFEDIRQEYLQINSQSVDKFRSNNPILIKSASKDLSQLFDTLHFTIIPKWQQNQTELALLRSEQLYIITTLFTYSCKIPWLATPRSLRLYLHSSVEVDDSLPQFSDQLRRTGLFIYHNMEVTDINIFVLHYTWMNMTGPINKLWLAQTLHKNINHYLIENPDLEVHERNKLLFIASQGFDTAQAWQIVFDILRN